ncbi:MAG: isoprenylcysteine carboxylmethyltransferase family protein [Planctomycetes bacterium]|nr:isoprenylcysteine carboxylmethyltransferase family protein [Planctomycetota bacterium]
MTAVDVVVLVAYATLVLELCGFPIPSEASTWQLLGSHGTGPAAPADALQQARARSLPRKLLCFLLPTALGVVAWLAPLACMVVPALADALGCTRIAALQWPGAGLVALGRTITFTSVLQLRAQRRHGGAPRFWFRRSRNPGLLGMYVCYLGLCVVYGSPLLWAVLPLYVANMHGRVRIEEAHLAARHGAAWTDYAARVPRYLGR